jgi:hypothetical protein
MVINRTIDLDELAVIIGDAKAVASRYRKLTGRPLGITGEVAEYEATRLLRLRLADVRQDGYDAVRETDGSVRKLQIKGRCILETSKRSQQVGAIKLKKQWDGVLLVLMDEEFEPLEIFEADRPAVTLLCKSPDRKPGMSVAHWRSACSNRSDGRSGAGMSALSVRTNQIFIRWWRPQCRCKN